MSTPRRDPAREDLVDAVFRGLRRTSTAAVFLHSAIAEKLGLSATDMKTMEVLGRVGPLTAGRIAAHTGLAPTSVTSLIDRLEKKRFVRRVRDPEDRRRVVVELRASSAGRLGAVFEPIAAATSGLLATYSNEELATIADFLTRSADGAFEHIAKLSGAPTEKGGRVG